MSTMEVWYIAKARNVHLMDSKTGTAPSYSWRMPILCESLTDHQNSTLQLSLVINNIKMHIVTFHHTPAHTMTQLTSCMGWTTIQSPSFLTLTASPLADMCLQLLNFINWWTGRFCQADGGAYQGVVVGISPLPIISHPQGWWAKHCCRNSCLQLTKKAI